MSSSPKVSIITVVYNGQKHLQEAMESVFVQDYPNIEYIVVDGGSTDGTLEIIRENESRIDRWISEPDRGIYDAMNKGIGMASGEIIGFLNADDLLYPGVVSGVVEAMGENPEEKYTCGPVDLIDQEGVVVGRSTPFCQQQRDDRKYLEMPCPHLSVFVGRDLYCDNGLFDMRFLLRADYDFLLRLMNVYAECCDLQFPVGGFRNGGVSGGLKTWHETRSVLKKHGVARWYRLYVFCRSLMRSFIGRKFPKWIVRYLKRFTVSQNQYGPV